VAPPANNQRFRGGLVSKAYRLLYHSTLGLRVIKKKGLDLLPSAEGGDGHVVVAPPARILRAITDYLICSRGFAVVPEPCHYQDYDQSMSPLSLESLKFTARILQCCYSRSVRVSNFMAQKFEITSGLRVQGLGGVLVLHSCSRPQSGVHGVRPPSTPGCYATKFAPQKALKLVS
jgi:hypothetical protein